MKTMKATSPTPKPDSGAPVMILWYRLRRGELWEPVHTGTGHSCTAAMALGKSGDYLTLALGKKP